MKYYILIFAGILLLLSCQNEQVQTESNPEFQNIRKKIISNVNLAEETNNSSEKKKYFDNVVGLIDQIDNDSLKIKYLKFISKEYLDQRHLKDFKSTNQRGLNLSKLYNDTINNARFNWDLGDYHLFRSENDSAYFAYSKARKDLELINETEILSNVIYNLALVQSKVKDFIGSEINLIQSVELAQKIKNYRLLYRCYNLLGIVNYNLENFEVAKRYHQNAMQALGKVDNNELLIAASFNNLGNVYEKDGDFKEAIKYYRRTLSTKNLEERDPELYAMALDNLSFNRLETGETENVSEDMKKALEIRKRINHVSGIAINQIHLAQFYVAVGDTSTAIEYAKRANLTAKSNNNNRDILASWKLLAELQPEESFRFTEAYINLSDSLQIDERKIRNKFERIRFETDEVIERAQLLEERQTMIFIVSSLVILVGSSIFIIFMQRSRNKALSLERDQKVADEKIYELMLSQKTRKDEGRKEERDRIARELHDHILTELYANRMNLMFYKYKIGIKGDKKFGEMTDNLMNIESQIRSLSHELSNTYFEDQKDFSGLIQDLLEKQNILESHKVTVDDDVNWTKVSSVIKMHVYRVLQESIRNIQKHANANFISFSFAYDKGKDGLNIEIQDDGIGFNSNKKPGIGLKNIRNRVDEVNGEINIDSKAGQGTKITIFIPIY
ncbi:tetratricopeptide repeat-containing sensor histidine kinase [Psychroflexus aestuariivivens]|uniref:tetratricopeptide repeat-containing sensor histidine kinase n=1 Tax=Psychroflexus aestuariivivens TaxID=1795040 RepID=UPI000FDCA2C5|nr:tetratricopeptide repeat-containing sensor histidine kinase [Psychroflexus aestuariivivens]